MGYVDVSFLILALDNERLASAILPTSLGAISDNAFSGSYALETMAIPTRVLQVPAWCAGFLSYNQN